MTFLDRILKIDRRWIFLLVALAVAIPLIIPIRLSANGLAPREASPDYSY